MTTRTMSLSSDFYPPGQTMAMYRRASFPERNSQRKQIFAGRLPQDCRKFSRQASTLCFTFDNTNPNTDRPTGGSNGHCRRRWSISASRPCRPRRCRSTGPSAWSRKSALLGDRQGMPTTLFSLPACTAPSLTLASRWVYAGFVPGRIHEDLPGASSPFGLIAREMSQRCDVHLSCSVFQRGKLDPAST